MAEKKLLGVPLRLFLKLEELFPSEGHRIEEKILCIMSENNLLNRKHFIKGKKGKTIEKKNNEKNIEKDTKYPEWKKYL